MSYKNTMKLFTSNFTLAWKQLVFMVCNIIIFGLCSYTLLSPVVTVLRDAGLGQQIKDLFSVVYSSPINVSLQITSVLKLVFGSIIENISKIYLNLIGCIFLCFIFPYVFMQISLYNVSSILYQKFTMNMDIPYTRNLVGNLSKSLKFAFTNLLLEIPYFAINILLIYLYILFSTTLFKSILGLMILSILLLILQSIKITLFSYYTGAVVAEEKSALSAFLKSFKIEVKNFWKITGISVFIWLTIIFINGIVSLFTLFAGLIFTVPATFVMLCIFKVITYLNLSGNRYYLSDTVIYNPKEYVVKKDDYVSTFIPPEEIKEITTTKMKKKYKKSTTKTNKIKNSK